MRRFLIIHTLVILLIGYAHIASAQQPLEYHSLVQLPFNLSAQDTQQFVTALYMVAITVAALLAVVKIIFGGVQYMLTDVMPTKRSAKEDIKGALLGLLIVISAVLILRTINPNLTKITFLQNAPGLDVSLSNQYKSSAERFVDNCVNNQGGTITSSWGGQMLCLRNSGVGQNTLPSGNSKTADRLLCESAAVHGIWTTDNTCIVPGKGELIPINGENAQMIQQKCDTFPGGYYDTKSHQCYSTQ